jgi:hypothetical protein
MKMAKRLTYGDGASGFRFVWEGGEYIDVYSPLQREYPVDVINTSSKNGVPDFTVANLMSEVREYLADPSNVSDIKENV